MVVQGVSQFCAQYRGKRGIGEGVFYGGEVGREGGCGEVEGMGRRSSVEEAVDGRWEMVGSGEWVVGVVCVG